MVSRNVCGSTSSLRANRIVPGRVSNEAEQPPVDDELEARPPPRPSEAHDLARDRLEDRRTAIEELGLAGGQDDELALLRRLAGARDRRVDERQAEALDLLERANADRRHRAN